jgi:hypothetical protein
MAIFNSKLLVYQRVPPIPKNGHDFLYFINLIQKFLLVGSQQFPIAGKQLVDFWADIHFVSHEQYKKIRSNLHHERKNTNGADCAWLTSH